MNNIIQFTNEQYQFFDGLVAGDGSLVKRRNKKSNVSLSIAGKYKGFIEYIRDYLQLDTSICHNIVLNDRYIDGSIQEYRVSKCNFLFNGEHNRWFKEYKKIIPQDFRFSPISMLILFLSDGCSSNNMMTISLNSFDVDNIRNTIGIGLSNIGIKYSIRKDSVLYIKRKHSLDFLKYIGMCPLKCYNYKWNIDGAKVKKIDKSVLEKYVYVDKLNTHKIHKLLGLSYDYVRSSLYEYGLLDAAKENVAVRIRDKIGRFE